MSAKALSEITAGDRVWVGKGSCVRARIQPVARLTPTLIILDGHYRGGAKSDLNRYRCVEGYGNRCWEVGGGFDKGYISGVATAEECAAWDAAEVVRREQAEAEKREADQRKSLQQELNGLFGESAYVEHHRFNQAGEWRVCVFMSEAGVRRLAVLLNGPEWEAENNDMTAEGSAHH